MASRSTRKPRRSAPRPMWALVAGVVTLGLIIGFIYFAENAYNGVPLLSYRTLYVEMPNIGHLEQHDPVEIAGVRVGQVLRTETRNDVADVELQMQGVGPIPVNSEVIVRADGLLGARYVELEPGSSATSVPNGATLREKNGLSTYTWGIPETLNLFNAKTRTALGQMINGMGTGVEGRGSQLNEAIHVGGPSGADFDTVADAILDRPGAAEALIPSSNAGFSALNLSASPLTTSFDPMSTTADAFVIKRAATEQTISELPGVENDIDAGFAAGAAQRVWASLDQLSASLATILPSTPTMLRNVDGLLNNGQKPLTEVRPVFTAVPGASRSTLAMLHSLKPDLSPLNQAFVDLKPFVSQLAEHGCDIQSFATGVDGLVSWGSTPGGAWGPDVGFPIGVVAGPNSISNQVDTGFKFADTSGYDAPCAFSPGPNTSETNLLKILAGSVEP